MKHGKEIKYWAEHPDGTRVWQRTDDIGSEWELNLFPKWHETFHYIVADEWAELRKAQEDGKQLQWKGSDAVLGYYSMHNTNIEDWRIKPDEPEEPVYEYQWIYRIPTDKDGTYYMSMYYCTDEEDFAKIYPNAAISGKSRYIPIEPYLPSKRIRK